MEELAAVVYRSQASRPLGASELDKLLIDARAFNERVRVSGALLHDQGAFLQYFEGPRDGVERVYARIRRSNAHEKLDELLYQPIDTRQFARWHMAFSQAPASILNELANEIWTMALPALRARQTRSPGLRLLLEFWDQTGQKPPA